MCKLFPELVQRWTFTALRFSKKAAPRFGLLKFGHRVYIMISVFLLQTLLTDLLCLQELVVVFLSLNFDWLSIGVRFLELKPTWMSKDKTKCVCNIVSGIPSVIYIFAMYHIDSGTSMDQVSLSNNR